jgi:transposase InsO family protein
MHKNTKLTPTLRREVYHHWQNSRYSFRQLADKYHVDKNIVCKVVIRGKLGDFSVHDSTNHRFRTIEYGLKRLAKTERLIANKIAKREKRLRRYEKAIPGEMVHGDTKRLPNIYVPGTYRKIAIKSVVLFVWIDDHSRWLLADLLPDRTMWSSNIFLETMALRAPFLVECHFSDNGGEYKGNSTHAFVAGCLRLGIEQRFTKPNHPWTNGKAERVIQTILREWYRPNKNSFKNLDEMKQSLYKYIDWYNHERKHQGINNLTPFDRLAQFYQKSGDNA